MKKIYTKETINNLSSSVKDMLCREYNWIKMTIEKDDHTYVKSFTEDAVQICCSQIEITGRCSKQFAETFIANLDLIKDLAENQPTYEIEITIGGIVGVEMHTHTYTETHKYYNIDKLHSKLNYIKNMKNYLSHKLIQNNLVD